MQNTSVINLLGTEATSFEDTLKAADLNWEPKSDTVSGTDTGILMPRKKLIYRSDNQMALGVVGEDYSASDPKEFLRTQYEFAQFIKGKVTRAGLMADRARAFAFVKMDSDIVVKPKDRKVGDICSCYIYSSDSWDGGSSRVARLYVERLRCLNGAKSSELKSDLYVRHTSGMEGNFQIRWKTFMNEVAASVEKIRTEFNKLAEARMSKDEMVKFAEQLLPAEGTRTANVCDTLVTLFGTGTGNEGATRWDAYNAVTEYVTHQRTYRETEVSTAETNRFLGVLESSTMTNKALSLLLN